MNAILLSALVLISSSSEQLYSEVSLPGESMTEFATRIAPKARETTKALDAEICGSFVTDGSTYRIDFQTNRNVWGCNIDFPNTAEWKNTRVTMHTHTEKGGNGFSHVDNKLKIQGYVVSYYTMTMRIGNRERTISIP